MFNVLDYLIIAIFVAIIGVGFFNGITKLLASIIAIYFGTLFAAALYGVTTRFVGQYLSISKSTGELTFFLILFFIFSTLFTAILSGWIGDLKLPRRVAVLDNLGGAALGVVVSGLAVTLAALVLAITLQALNYASSVSTSPGLGLVREQIRSSTLVPVFLEMAPFYVRLISPWFPGGLPPILNFG
jgi:uncharacterized membrane protein required for colicin V production